MLFARCLETSHPELCDWGFIVLAGFFFMVGPGLACLVVLKEYLERKAPHGSYHGPHHA